VAAAELGINVSRTPLAIWSFDGRWAHPGRSPASRSSPSTSTSWSVAVVYAAGGTASVADALGPATAPLPRVLILGAAVLSVPWWAHRHRRPRVRVERKLEAWPDIVRAIGPVGSQVMSATVDVSGWRARLRLARGQTITDVIARASAIKSGLGTFRGTVRVYPTLDDLANRREILAFELGPHARLDPRLVTGQDVESAEDSDRSDGRW
jgi:hypothetical protein